MILFALSVISFLNDLLYSFQRSNNYTDENTWGALWLYKATQDDQYMTDAKVRFDHAPGWGFSWDEKTAGFQVSNIHFKLLTIFVNGLISLMCFLMKRIITYLQAIVVLLKTQMLTLH